MFTDQYLCQHRQFSKVYVALYCFLVSLFYVISLYIFVPAKIRSLDRNNPSHIKCRLWIVVGVSIVSSMLYSSLFCDGKASNFISAKEYLGWKYLSYDDLKILLHCMVLFGLPLLLEGRSKVFNAVTNYPTYEFLRDIVIAPMTEEVVFRGCLAAPLLSSNFSVIQATFIAPLFFGTAHIHHLILKLRSGIPLKKAILISLVQFTYTYLFGAYSTYAFIKTGSIVGVSLSHTFCNFMGLPNLSFIKPWSKLYRYRWLISTGLFISIFSFVWLFPVFYGESTDVGTMSAIEKLTLLHVDTEDMLVR